MRGTRCAELLSWTTVRLSAVLRTTIEDGVNHHHLRFCAVFFRHALELLAPLLIALTAFHSMAAIPSMRENQASLPTRADFRTRSQEIKVRLDTVGSSFTVTGVGLRFPGSSQTRKAAGFQALRVRWNPGTAGLVIWTIEDRDTGLLLQRFKARALEIAGGQLRVNLRSVSGQLILAPKRRSRTDVIANLDLEEYVRGVLPAEMPKDWPLEALKAQAIAARTYALFRKRSREAVKAPYHVESTVMDQVYRSPIFDDGLGAETVKRAVRETEGMILVTLAERPAPLAAYFHADCGGRTEDAQAVWGEAGVGTTVCPFTSRPSWRASLSLAEIESHVRSSSKRSSSASLVGVEPIGRTISGRIEKIRLAWNNGEETLMPAHEFRMSLGHDRVRSTNFRVEAVNGERIQIVGQGAGHGVGLCQWGARHLAMNGKDFRDILKLYYPRSRLAISAEL